MNQTTSLGDFKNLNPEQLPVAKSKLKGWQYFAGLYAGEHVAATEFVIGATFVALGAKTMDIVVGLLIGNLLAILSWLLITSPIAVETRLSLYTYLNKIAGDGISKLYDGVNILMFTVISAAMITVSSTAFRFAFNFYTPIEIPAQLDWYPNNLWFIGVVFVVGLIAVFVAIFGFNAVSEFSGICAPWLFVMFLSGAFVLLPALSLNVLQTTLPSGWSDLVKIGDTSIWTGITPQGKEGISLLEIIGFAWAANSITHFGLIDMALFRYAKKSSYGLATSTGMLFGHYIAWISAGIMGAGTAVLVNKTILELDPGDVAYQALGLSGFVIVIIAGWTTAITNLYRAGLATQSIFSQYTSKQTTLVVGVVMTIMACFPFIYLNILPLLSSAGLLVVPVGAVVFTEHQIFPRIGYTRYWFLYLKRKSQKEGLPVNEVCIPAILTWLLGIVFGFGVYLLLWKSFFVFVPTWLVSIGVYIFLAGRYGAKENYDQEAHDEAIRDEAIEHYQDQQDAQELSNSKQSSVSSSTLNLAKFLQLVSILALILIMYWSCVTLFGSPSKGIYDTNKQLFYHYGIIGTLVYFVTAFIAMKLSKKQ